MNATTKYVSRLTGAQKQLDLNEDHSLESYQVDLTHAYDQNEASNLINSKALTQEYLDELQSYEKSLQDWFGQNEDKDIRVSLFGGIERWNGTREWNGME